MPDSDDRPCRLTLTGAAPGGWCVYACSTCGYECREQRGDRPTCAEGRGAPRSPLGPPGAEGGPLRPDIPNSEVEENFLISAPEPTQADVEYVQELVARGAVEAAPVAKTLVLGAIKERPYPFGPYVPTTEDASGSPNLPVVPEPTPAKTIVRGVAKARLSTRVATELSEVYGPVVQPPEPVAPPPRTFRVGGHCERIACDCRLYDQARVVGTRIPPLHDGCDCVLEEVPGVAVDFRNAPCATEPPLPLSPLATVTDITGAAERRGRDVAEVNPNQVLVNALNEVKDMEDVLVAASFNDDGIGVSWSKCSPEVLLALARAAGIEADRRLVEERLEVEDVDEDPTG